MNEKLPNESYSSSSIDILELWHIFWSAKFLILACAAVAMILAAVKVIYFTHDVFSSDGLLYISNRNDLTQSDIPNTFTEDAVYGSDLNTQRMMSVTYAEILRARGFLEDVCENVTDENGLPKYNWEQIRAMLSVSVVNETELVNVNVNCGDADDAYNITNAVLKCSQVKLEEIGGQVIIISSASEPEMLSKGLMRYLLISCVVGIFIGCAIAFLLDFFDNRVRSSDDIIKRYNISVLGEISR